MSEFEDSPAFPIIHPDGSGVQYYGMTLRDYFAAKAMGAIIMNSETQRELENIGREEGMIVISRVAYMQADAMILERAKW